MSNFESAIQIILEHEGGFVNDPLDHGGETNFGISLNMIVHNAHLTPKDLDLPNFDPGCMKLLKKEKAVDIYKRLFWEANHLSNIKDQNAATKCLDVLVNMSPKSAIICIQKACSATADGFLGPKTFESINAMGAKFESVLAITMKQRYDDIITAYPNQVRFAKTWFARAACVAAARCICHPHHKQP